jgi:Arc/MetJ-type ribon-helix-helix transcriptional regulator
MTTLRITLSESMQEFVDGQTAAGGFDDAGKYLQSLIRAEQRRAKAAKSKSGDAPGAGAAAAMKTDWDGMRQQGQDRLKRLRQRKSR